MLIPAGVRLTCIGPGYQVPFFEVSKRGVSNSGGGINGRAAVGQFDRIYVRIFWKAPHDQARQYPNGSERSDSTKRCSGNIRAWSIAVYCQWKCLI